MSKTLNEAFLKLDLAIARAEEHLRGYRCFTPVTVPIPGLAQIPEDSPHIEYEGSSLGWRRVNSGDWKLHVVSVDSTDGKWQPVWQAFNEVKTVVRLIAIRAIPDLIDAVKKRTADLIPEVEDSADFIMKSLNERGVPDLCVCVRAPKNVGPFLCPVHGSVDPKDLTHE